MPCDFGYKTVTKISVPTIQSQKFKEEVCAPDIDRDLLNKIGVDDSQFSEWLNELEIRPLLEIALQRTNLSSPGVDGLINVCINKNERLLIKANFTTKTEKKRIQDISDEFSNRFQMEVLGIVAEILGYQIAVIQKEQDGGLVFIVMGEKATGTDLKKYLRITKSKSGDGKLLFEHFESKKAIEFEQRRFLALAQKMGVLIFLRNIKREQDSFVVEQLNRAKYNE